MSRGTAQPALVNKNQSTTGVGQNRKNPLPDLFKTNSEHREQSSPPSGQINQGLRSQLMSSKNTPQVLKKSIRKTVTNPICSRYELRKSQPKLSPNSNEIMLLEGDIKSSHQSQSKVADNLMSNLPVSSKGKLKQKNECSESIEDILQRTRVKSVSHMSLHDVL